MCPDSQRSSDSNSPSYSIGQCATLACVLEVLAPKPGNVHRGADFEDVTFGEFILSAVAIGPAMEMAGQDASVGQTVLEAVQATQRVVNSNTNLGMVLLLSPLACVPSSRSLEEGIGEVLEGLTQQDTRLVYQAIGLAAPGGLGQVQQMDIADEPPQDLLEAMAEAAERDLVARQYSNCFGEVFGQVLPRLLEAISSGLALSEAILVAQLSLMSEFPDSLIARKCGQQIAEESAARAGKVLAAGRPGDVSYLRALEDFDFWLRSDGHRRNPGTTADMLAAGIFVGLREGKMTTLV